jgi:shikimate kinase
MLPNFVLIGFMGSGKTTVGRRLASLTGHRFLDSDELVANRAQRGIPEIFATDGEEGFRRLEEATLAELVGVAGVVLSTGGGAVLREANRATMKKTGIVVWLDSDPDILFDRAMRSGRRPLLQTENPRASFDALLSARREIYESAADLRIDTSQMELEDVAKRVLEQAMRFRAAGTLR